MKAFRILGRNIRDSFKSVFRNFSLSLASITCITITLVVVSIAIVLSYNVNNFASLVKKDVTIVAFLNADIKTDKIDYVEEEINSIPGVENYTFESKRDIMDEMMKSSEIYASIMADWSDEDSPIQPTFQVKVSDIEDIGEIATSIKKISGVKSVSYGEGLIEQLISIFDIVKKISIVVVAALVIVTAFLITNTIKITIYSRKSEIGIMRLVGASNLNIKIPFILEGLFLGMMGSVIPIFITVYGYSFLYNSFKGQVISPFIKLVPVNPFVFKLSLILLGIGVLVGMFGSLTAVKKHLKI